MTPVQTDEFVTPKIKKITTQGEVFVHWDKPMKQPRNHTNYVERLKEVIHVEELISRKKFFIPALEVTYVPSYAQTTKIVMQWEFINWKQSNIVIL